MNSLFLLADADTESILWGLGILGVIIFLMSGGSSSSESGEPKQGKLDIAVGDQVAKNSLLRWWTGTAVEVNGNSYTVRIDYAEPQARLTVNQTYSFVYGEIKRI